MVTGCRPRRAGSTDAPQAALCDAGAPQAELCVALRRGDDNNSVRRLLDQGAAVDAADAQGWTPLTLAASKGDVDVAALLLDRGADMAQAKQNGASPLHIAAEKGHEAVAALLLDRGADVAQAMEGGASPLYIAAQNGHESVAALLLDRGADVSQATQNGVSPLHGAAYHGHEAVAALLLDRGADVAQVMQDGASPLFIAAQQGHEAVAALLLDRGADMAQAKQNGASPLHIAAEKGHEAVAALLLDRGADVAQARQDGASPLVIAAQEGHEAVAALLLDRGAGVSQAMQNGVSPLHVAAYNGHEAVAALLLDRGADVVAQARQDGASPLVIAAEEGHEAVARLLLDRGADVSQATQDGFSPLFNAAQDGHEAVATLLLDRGADVAQATHNGFSPLFIAALNGHEAVARLLLDRGADVAQATQDGASPLHFAAWHGHEGVARLLLDRGANVAQANQDNASPLGIAALNGHEAVAALLLDRGADVSQVTQDGTSPLHAAAWNGHEAVAALLLDRGADVGQTTQEGFSPLFNATQNGHEAVAKLLLDRGADVSQATQDGSSPLFIAAEEGHEAVASLLLDRGADVAQARGDGQSPADAAAQNGHLAVFKLLRSRDSAAAAAVVAQAHGETEVAGTDSDASPAALCDAVWRGDDNNSVHRLLEQGAAVDAADAQGWTPLTLAAWKGDVDVAALLLDRGADVAQADRDGFSPLHLAAQEGHEVVAALLLDRGADVAQANRNGASLVHIAAQQGHEAVAALLLDRGADVSQAKQDGTSPLFIAALKGHEAVARVLLDRGANVAQAKQDGSSPLFIAAEKGHEGVARVLLDRGANVAQAKQDGTSPLFIAAANGHEAVARLLLDHGADAAQARDDGQSPLAAALQTGHEAVVELLRSRVAASVQQADAEVALAHAHAELEDARAEADALRAEVAAAKAVAERERAKRLERHAVDRAAVRWGPLIGRGSFGAVHKARHLGEVVAGKRFVGETQKDAAEVLEEMKKEAHVLGLLRHRNVIRFVGACYDPEDPFMLLEFAERGSLAALLADHDSPLPMATQFNVLHDVARGMWALHNNAQHQVLHRDLKPSNVLVAGDWSAKVADFGLACAASTTLGRTRGGGMVGTVGYIAPEVLDDDEDDEEDEHQEDEDDDGFSVYSDVYAFAVVAYEVTVGPSWRKLNGKPLKPNAIMKKVGRGERPPVPSTIDPFFEQLLADCWAQDPQARPTFDAIMERFDAEKSEFEARHGAAQESIESMLQQLMAMAKEGNSGIAALRDEVATVQATLDGLSGDVGRKLDRVLDGLASSSLDGPEGSGVELALDLPQPRAYRQLSRSGQTVLQMEFYCSCGGAGCLFRYDGGTGRPFVVEARDWGRWARAAIGAGKVGLAAACAVVSSNPSGLVGVLRDAVADVYQGGATALEDFVADGEAMRETLREQGFFDAFEFGNGRTGAAEEEREGWVCTLCALPTTHSAAPETPCSWSSEPPAEPEPSGCAECGKQSWFSWRSRKRCDRCGRRVCGSHLSEHVLRDDSGQYERWCGACQGQGGTAAGAAAAAVDVLGTFAVTERLVSRKLPGASAVERSVDLHTLEAVRSVDADALRLEFASSIGQRFDVTFEHAEARDAALMALREHVEACTDLQPRVQLAAGTARSFFKQAAEEIAGSADWLRRKAESFAETAEERGDEGLLEGLQRMR